VLFALALIVVAARLVGRVFERWLGQPAVIGEIVAGLLLGPSAFGALLPGASRWLLPPDVVGHVGVLANIGVVFFLFLVGLELDTHAVRAQSRTVAAVAIASIAVPGAIGVLVGIVLGPLYAPPSPAFSLFVGTALAVTAFPVLARILTDKCIQATRLGGLALGCAAVIDVAAWVLLAFVSGVASAQIGGAVRTSVLVGGYALAMILVARPIVLRFVAHVERQDGPLSRNALATSIVALLLSAMATEAIGIHALFGAFAMGALVPHDSRLARELRARLEDVVVVLLLPAFFASTGLKTEIGLLGGARDWAICGGIVLLASVGKIGGSMIAARSCGIGWRASGALGVLLNTRGLMELVVLNVGLDMGILPPMVFAMLVLMAITTTILTTPLLSLVLGGRDVESLVPEPDRRPVVIP
jgi:Kef-type K+ transport system membrane component KefB